MAEQESPRTRLEQLLRQRHVTLEEFRKHYQRIAGTALSERQAYRWVAGEVRGLPYPQAQAALERLFGEPVARLLGLPYGTGAPRPTRRRDGAAPERGNARTDWEGQVIAMSADRARDFLTRIEASNVGAETLDQLIDDVRRLVTAYQQQPLPTLLSDLVDTRDRAFGLLEGRQRPAQTRDLYLLTGIACGLMAKASHDLGAPHDAMTHARTGYACADNAGHDGLRAWTRGLQALITYWSGRLDDSVRYAQLGAEAAARSRGTAGIWLSSSEARSLAASSTTPPTRSPGAARSRRMTPNGLPCKHWTPTPRHPTRTGPSAMNPVRAAPLPSHGFHYARSTAPRKRSRQCSNSPRRSEFTGS